MVSLAPSMTWTTFPSWIILSHPFPNYYSSVKSLSFQDCSLLIFFTAAPKILCYTVAYRNHRPCDGLRVQADMCPAWSPCNSGKSLEQIPSVPFSLLSLPLLTLNQCHSKVYKKC